MPFLRHEGSTAKIMKKISALILVILMASGTLLVLAQSSEMRAFLPAIYYQPTPTTAPTPIGPTPTPSSSAIQITHIEYDPDGDDSQGEYVLIYNLSHSPMELDNWTLQDSDSGLIYLFPNAKLTPGAYLRVWNQSGTDKGTDYYWGADIEIWNNGGECGSLRDAANNLVHVYCY